MKTKHAKKLVTKMVKNLGHNPVECKVIIGHAVELAKITNKRKLVRKFLVRSLGFSANYNNWLQELTSSC